MAKIYQHSGAHLFLLLWKASRAVMAYDQASIGRLGFASLTDFAVLELLLHKGALPVSAIGARVLLTSGSMTTAVQRLEKKGYLRRERSADDARVVLVHLTTAGRELIEPAFETHAGALDQLFAELDEDARVQFAGLMRQLGQRAETLKH